MVSAVLSVKPLDSETDLGRAEELIRALELAECLKLEFGGCRQGTSDAAAAGAAAPVGARAC